MKHNQSVVVIGGGHVGLSFALLLAHYGIGCTVLEKTQYPKIDPDKDTKREQYLDSRNTALSRRTVEIYHKIGLWGALQDYACPIDRVLIKEQGGFGAATLHKEAEGVENFGQVVENAWLGRQLLLAVQNNRHIHLLDNVTVTDIREQGDQVTVWYHKNDDENLINLSASIVVACDGQNSVARQILGIETSVYDYQQVGIVGVVETTKPHDKRAVEYFTKQGLLAVLPLAGGENKRRSVVWVCHPRDQERYLIDDAYFLNVLTQVFGREAGQFVKAGKRGSYPLTKVIAKKQVLGRVVLMGNAAHTLHPVAAQGFNLCVRDAYALANLLNGAKEAGTDFGDHQALLAYEKSRQKDQKRVMLFCDTVVHSFTHQNPLVKFGRNLGLIAFDKVPYVKPMVARFAMGFED